MLQVRVWSQSAWSVVWLTALTGCPKLSVDTSQFQDAPKAEQRAKQAEADAGTAQGEPRAADDDAGLSGEQEEPPACEGDGASMCCGDGSCDGPEDARNCAADCEGADLDGGMGALPGTMEAEPRACDGEVTTMCCGDGACDGPETHDNCAADCAEGQTGSMAGGGTGQDPTGQDPSGTPPLEPRACAADITSMCCGDGMCDGPETHDNCAADCAEGQSGSTGGTGGGASMPMDPRPCSADVTSMCCGDGTCDGPESADNCAADC